MKLGIIGCGNMGSALISGIFSKGILPSNNIYASDKDVKKAEALQRKCGISLGTNEEIAKTCDVLIIAVKPEDSGKLLLSISNTFSHLKHVISIMAGVKISKIESLINKKIAVTRAMPNMAALAGKGMTCLSHNKRVKDKSFANRIFSSVGEVMEIDERDMDAVTAVSGSGPAYFFYLAECLRDAACKLGIKKEKAERLAISTLVGSGALLDCLNESPEALVKRIASKKGTTEAALSVLKSGKFSNIINEAVKAARNRSKELSKGE